MILENLSNFAFYSVWLATGYIVSSIITTTVDGMSDFRTQCYVDLQSGGILSISIALGILTGLNVVKISTKLRRLVVYTTIAFILLQIYSALLQSASYTQVNLLEILLRDRINASVIFTSEFVALLITKATLSCIFHEIIRNLYYLIGGKRSVKVRMYPRRSRKSSAPENPSPKKVRFSNSK